MPPSGGPSGTAYFWQRAPVNNASLCKKENQAMVKANKRAKRAPYMKLGKADVTLHLQKRGGRVELSVILPASISKILARRLDKRMP
jgi:hypothetical protein